MQDFRVATFLTVCRTMNYTRAAEELHITQPAVSQHIAYLEKVYGAPLFNYRNKKLFLTAAGRMLHEALATMAHDEALLRDRIAGAALGLQVELTVGMTLTAGEYVVAAPLADFLAAHPAYRVTVRSGDTAKLMALLDAGAVDCAFVEGLFDGGAYAADTYRSERFVCVCAADYAFDCEPHYVKDLLKEHLLMREPGSGTRAVLEHALAACNMSVDSFVQVSVVESLNIMKVLVERGLGVAFMYEAAAARELKAGTLRIVELEDFAVEHDISFIRLPNSVFEHEFQRVFHELVTHDA